MIAANIGKIFLKAYNEKYQSNYTAKEFFVEKYWSLFYNNEKYMQWITNSAFNPGNHLGDISSEGRKIKLTNLCNTISQNKFDEKNVIGYSISDITGTTSGQVTNLKLPITEHEAYCSWIGSGFGIDLDGFSILIPNITILLDIYEGWDLYRDYLNKTPQLKGNQIDAWNSRWLIHRYHKLTYDPNNPYALFNPLEITEDGTIIIGKLPWSKVLFALAREYPNLTFTSYVYKLGFNKPNVTIGFISIKLPKLKYITDLYDKFFGTSNKLLAESFFGTEKGFTKACEMGEIGVSALEPKGFRDCFVRRIIPKYNANDEAKSINFNTYLIWILAMLNNEKLWDSSREIALKLIKYKTGAEKSRTNRKADVENLLRSTTSRQFLQNLIPLIEEEKEIASFEEIGKLVHLMPIDNFPYFNTLIRFQYALLNK